LPSVTPLNQDQELLNVKTYWAWWRKNPCSYWRYSPWLCRI